MNGNNRLYRSTSEGMLGGVAAGLARYFNTDVNVIRLLMVLAAFFTGGAVVAVYLALWLLLPTVSSTSNDVGGIMQENLNEMAHRIGFRSNNPNGGNTTTVAGNGPNVSNVSNVSNGGPSNAYNSGQAPQARTTSTPFTPSIGAIILIALGGFLLLANFGVFHFFRWNFFWPLLLVGLGVMLLMKKR